MMPFFSRFALRFAAFSLLAFLVGCEESEDDRRSRMEKSMDNARVILKYDPNALKPDEAPGKPSYLPSEDPSKPLILFCAADLGDPFQRLQSDLMSAAVRTLDGWRFKTLDAKGDSGLQLDHLAKVSEEHPVYLIIQPIEDRLTASLMESVRSAGVHVLSLDQRMPASACELVSFTDQAKIGRVAGTIVLEALKRKAADEHKPQVTGRVVMIRGRATAYESKARAEAFLEVLHAEPGIIVVHDAPGDWTIEGGKKRTADALRLQGQFDVVFAHNDAMAQGVSEALLAVQKREEVLIVGVDGVGGTDGGLELLRRGAIDATVRQPMPMETAFLNIQKAIGSKDHAMPPRAEHEPQAVTPANVEDFFKKQPSRN